MLEKLFKGVYDYHFLNHFAKSFTDDLKNRFCDFLKDFILNKFNNKKLVIWTGNFKPKKHSHFG